MIMEAAVDAADKKKTFRSEYVAWTRKRRMSRRKVLSKKPRGVTRNM
jgi:hypothetical protein